MVETLISAAIVAGSIMVIGIMALNHSKLVKRSQVKQDLPGVGTDVLNRVRSVMLDTKNEATGLKTESLCGLLQPREVQPGVTQINLILERDIAPATKWKAAFAPEWEVVSVDTTNRPQVHLTLRPTLEVESLLNGIDRNSATVKVSVRPLNINPLSDRKSFFAEIAGNEVVDAKKVVYLMESKTTYKSSVAVEANANNNTNLQEAEAKELLSVIDIGSCDIRDSAGRVLSMSPAGTGAGDPAARTIYNDTEYEKASAQAFDFAMAANEITQGRNIDGRLSANPEKNVVSSCTETSFRCPQIKKNRTYRSFINIYTNVSYNSNNDQTTKKMNSVRVAPEAGLQDEAGRDWVQSRRLSISYAGQAGMSYRRANDGLYYPVNERGELEMNSPLRVGQSDNRLLATIENAEPFCRDLCAETPVPLLFPTLKLSTPDIKVQNEWLSQSGTTQIPLACTMCFTKACTRVGPGTFGPLEEFPPEPYDANIPECAAQDGSVARKSLPFAEETVVDVTSQQCVSAHIENGKFIYRARSCSDSLPALCFAFGEYILAHTLEARTTPRLVTFDAAARACREMGREAHVKSVLREGIEQMGGSTALLDALPVRDGKYNFLNLAKAGIFVAPQSGEERTQAVASLQKSPLLKSNPRGEFWVGLRTLHGNLVAEVPLAPTTNTNEEQHLLYVEAGGQMSHKIVRQTPQSVITPPGPGQVRAHVLFNHVKFRGVAAAAAEQDQAYPFLCLNDQDRFFLSRNADKKFSQGGRICEDEGGLFVAPHSPLGWMQALLAVDPHDLFLPFSPRLNSPQAAWVALQDNVNKPALQGELAKLGNPVLPLSSQGASDSVVNADGALVAKEAYLELKTATNTWEPKNNVRYKAACFSARERGVFVRDLSAGCNNGEVRLFKDDLQKPLYSFFWVRSKKSFALRNLEFIKVRP